MYSNETIRSFINRCQLRLDQEFDAGANFWSVAEMVEYTNEGVRAVVQAVRETHENWFTKELNSTDPVVKINGRNYSPKALQLVQGRDKLLLPPDFQELLFLEPIPTDEFTDPWLWGVTFEYRNTTQRAFRHNALNQFNNTPIPDVRHYYYDVVYAPTGSYISLSPKVSFVNTSPREIQIRYLFTPPTLTLDDTFEGTGLTNYMTDALLHYVRYAAAGKEDLVENRAGLEHDWQLKQELAIRNAGPKQTRDPVPVEGMWDGEYD